LVITIVFDGVPNRSGKVVNVLRDIVCKVAIFGIVPYLLHRVEFRGIGREPFDTNLVRVFFHKATHRGAVYVPSIQDKDDLVSKSTAQVVYETK